MITALQEFNVLGDCRGQLIALEANKQVPFDIKRVFYVFGTQDGATRGNHSHYKTKQFLVSDAGSCKAILSNGKENDDILSMFVHDNFPLTSSWIIRKFDLDYPSEGTFLYADVASPGRQVGQSDYLWEKLEKLEIKKELA